MPTKLNSILLSLRTSNYLAGKCVTHNENNHCEFLLLKNGFKVREQLLKEWSITWPTQYGGIQEIKGNPLSSSKRSPLYCINQFREKYENVVKEKLVNSSNSIALKTICTNVLSNDFVSEGNLCYGSKTKTLLVTDFFVTAEDELSKYYRLQRERKIWWMRNSFDPSRYRVEPHDLIKEKDTDEMLPHTNSVTIQTNFPYGSVNMENIMLVPLHKLDAFNLPFSKNLCKISLIRSIINLDLTTCALILDATVYRTENRNETLMLNRKLSPYQLLLANCHQGNSVVDELTLHLQYVINRSGIRLYGDFVTTNIQTELDKKILMSDSLGIPYLLLVNDDSTKNGLIKMRSRNTTLFETIHITDIPNYLLKIFKQ